MIGSIGSSSFDFSSIGSVHQYATNLVKNYMADNGGDSGGASSTGASADLVSGFVNNAQGTTNAVVKNTAAFSKQNAANLNRLKSAASALGNAARSAKDGNAQKIVNAAQAFASAYNSSVDHLMNGSADGAGVQKALSYIADNRMTRMSAASFGGGAASRLQSLGISIDDDGMMQVDAKKLTAAFEKSPASVESALSGYGSLSDTTQNNVDKALRIPSATYTDFSKMQVKNSLVDSLFRASGSLFDFSL
ncbi:MAG TPA: hypothetical protein DEB31_07050 [Clostridiales bacterium]|nr:hypothetical protein [Clostridiales bacterium]